MELYRIMSFFELYELLIKKHLKITKLKLMEDSNEGFAYTLKNFLPSTFNPGFALSTNMSIKPYIHARETNFITCWTKEKESMAMWLLYSKDFKSIRIKTSKEKLKKVMDDYLQEKMYYNHLYSEPGTLMTNQLCQVEDVKYIDFEDYRKKIFELKKEFDSEIQNLKDKTNENYTNIIVKFNNKSEELISHKDMIFLKNEAFKHEHEVRGSVSLVFRNKMNNEEVKKRLEREDTMSDLLGTFIFQETKPNDFVNVYYINLNMDHFIEEICFDPRMPIYQKDIYLEILGLKNDRRVVPSNIFGSYVELLK